MKHNCMEWSNAVIKIDAILNRDFPEVISCYGPAISKIEYVEKFDTWVAHCDEYATFINFCPFCGKEL